MVGLVQAALDETNTSYRNSSIQATLLLTSTSPVNYTEGAKSIQQIVQDLQRTNDGLADGVHPLRDQQRADLVIMVIRSDPAWCGWAAAIKATRSSAFAVVGADCLYSGNLSFAHEIGHLQGARHDLYVDNSTTPYRYGHGYVDPNLQWRTIMAYPDRCQAAGRGRCPPIPYWSNPNVIYPLTGQLMGTVTDEHNARVLNWTAYDVRDFAIPGVPGYFQALNAGATGQTPRYRWPEVAAPAYYTVYRCPLVSGSCSTPTSLPIQYTDDGSTWSVDDVMRRIGGSGCVWTTYYVRTWDPVDGTSPSSPQQQDCVW